MRTSWSFKNISGNLNALNTVSEVDIRPGLFLDWLFFYSTSCIRFPSGFYRNCLIMCQHQSAAAVLSSYFLPLRFRCFMFTQLESWHRFVSNICLLFSIPLSLLYPPLLFSLSPLFYPNWRLKREFHILAASNDERPLISVYPCRWCKAAATWDSSIFFYVVPLLSRSSPSLLYAGPQPKTTWNTKYIGLWYDKHLLWSVVCEVGCK